MLRFITAGSVDDGKSTLIGRLLYDGRAISLDVLEAIERSTKNNGDGKVDLALLTDGLRAEREQGITIDVAYKYFSTVKRKFIIADTPGHVQYTRNMVTGASSADLAIILIDARLGVTEQTYRHSVIAHLLGIPQLVVCVNKIDLVNYSKEVFNTIVSTYKAFADKLGIASMMFIPVSAKHGDNIVERSAHTPWYSGPTLLNYLEEVPVLKNNAAAEKARFSVQYIIRPQTEALHDYRGYAGKIISGSYKKGDSVSILPSGYSSKIRSIEVFEKEVEEAIAPMSVILHLEDDIDISRGDYIVKNDELPLLTTTINATVCWMSEKPLNAGTKLLLQHQGKISKAVVKDVLYKLDVNTLEQDKENKAVTLNTICQVSIRVANQIAVDVYRENRSNGGFIFIDEHTNDTVGVGMINGEVH